MKNWIRSFNIDKLVPLAVAVATVMTIYRDTVSGFMSLWSVILMLIWSELHRARISFTKGIVFRFKKEEDLDRDQSP